ncbi:MAG: carbohydrate porin [Candidatus Kapabacteria bacterium]|nr:carbohydrate porin [Candidatus Kapabacteria bacterium]
MKYIYALVFAFAMMCNSAVHASTVVKLSDEAANAIDPTAPAEEESTPVFSYGLLMSGVMQGHNAFFKHEGTRHALGNGALSLTARPFASTVINVSPMWMYGGMTLNGFGMAGNSNALFSSSNITPFLGTAYIKQQITFDASAGEEQANAIITAGKILMPAVFEANSYASDPTQQFLNMSNLSFGAWETAQETRGTTYGASVKFSKASWNLTIAGGLMPSSAGGLTFDTDVNHANSIVAQFCSNIHGTLRMRFLGFVNHANQLNFKQATALLESSSGTDEVDLEPARSYSVKYGFGIEAEDKLGEDVGAFIRASWNDGASESFTFTQINSSVGGGLDFSNSFFGTESSHGGVAFSYNMISSEQREYLAAGGSGFMLGYGSLNYSSEFVGEAYYRINVIEKVTMTFDYQFIGNAGYNKSQSLHFFTTRFTLSL